MNSSPKSAKNPAPEQRAELAALRARYYSGAVAPGIYAIIRQLEVDIAWTEHQSVRP